MSVIFHILTATSILEEWLYQRWRGKIHLFMKHANDKVDVQNL